jgi:hypothetical protein
MSITPRSVGSATTEDIDDYKSYIIDGIPYFIETPRYSYSPPEDLIVWNNAEVQIGTVGQLKDTAHQHVYFWVYRNLERIYGDISEIPVSPATIPTTPQQEAQQEYDDMQSPAPSPLRLEDAVMESPIRQPNLDELSVMFNELTASCMYYYDGNSFMPTQPHAMYPVSLLTCATPTGFFPIIQLSAEHDYHIDINTSSFMLNPANIRGSAFALTKHSPDVNKRVVVTVPPHHLSVLVNHGSFSNLICLYIPPGSSSPAMTYRTDIVLNPLNIGVNCFQSLHPNSQGNPNFHVTMIDPHVMTVECLETLDNVHITGNIQLAQCPSERLIAARVATPEELVTPLRALVYNLNRELPSREFDLFRLPYVYEINVQTNTCTKTPINADEIMKLNTENGMSYLSRELYVTHIAPQESLLIRNMLFQMMFVYEKIGPGFKASCPPHKMLFDFYLRRDSSQVAFHYDRTAFFEVSTLSLLFIMPDGVTRPGPHIIPMPTQIDPSVPGGMRYLDPETRSDRLTRVCTFQVQNGTCVMCNNTFTSHSTPGTTQLFERGVKTVSWLNFNPHDPDDPANAKRFHFPEMHIPDEYKARMEATKIMQRSFIRMWHVVSDPVRDSTGIFGHPQIMFPAEVFDGMVNTALELQGHWLRGARCICLELTEYTSPTEMSEKVHGTVRGAFGGRHASSSFKTKSAKLAKLAKSASVSLKAKEMHSNNQFRASTMSSVREKIKRKLMQFEKIYKDANQNVLMIRGKHKAAHGGTRRAGGLLSKRRHTRKSRFNKK